MVFRSAGPLCHDQPVSPSSHIKLRLSPAGWFFNAVVFTFPVTLSTLVSLGKSRPVHITALGFIWFGALDALIVLRHVRTATILEPEGIRMRRSFTGGYLRWSEITGVEINGRGKLRFVQARTSSGQVVRLPAPIEGGGFDKKQFDTRAAQIAAAWKAARPGEAGTVEPGSGVVDVRGGSRRF